MSVTAQEVRRALTEAGYGEAVVASGGVRVTTAGFRAYEHEGTVRLGYWPADGDFEGAHPDAPGVRAVFDGKHAAYAQVLAEAGLMVGQCSPVLVVTGRDYGRPLTVMGERLLGTGLAWIADGPKGEPWCITWNQAKDSGQVRAWRFPKGRIAHWADAVDAEQARGEADRIAGLIKAGKAA